MKKTLLLLLSLLMLASVAYNVAAAATLSTEQKFEELRKEGIFTGFADGSSRLYETMSREQFAMTLYRLFELSDTTYSRTFEDVARTRWSHDAIRAVVKSGLMNGVSATKFSPDTNVTVEQLAAVLVRATGYENAGTGFVHGTVSPWARAAVRIALDKGLIQQMGDYTANATRGALVEAIYAVYADLYEQPISIKNLTVISNRVIMITLKQSVKNITDDRVEIRDRNGRYVDVTVSSISADGLTVVLFTEPLASGTEHRLYFDGKETSRFNAVSDDQVKPVVSSIDGLTSRTVEVIFSEPVEEDSAENANNYRFNNGLRVSRAELTSDRRVLITTNEQQNNGTYELTIRGVKDTSGNTMDQTTRSFANDNTKPTVSAWINPTATITVQFSEKVDKTIAEQTGRYSIDKGLSVTQAKLESDGRTVTLKTTSQRDGTLYRLTIGGIPDLAGNVMDNATIPFASISDPDVPVDLQSLAALNNNTVEVKFDRAISDADVKNLKLYILKDNGNGVSMTDWNQFALRKDDKTAIVQFRTKSENPKLFVPGHLYLGRVSGVASLVTNDDQDEDTFAGTNAGNPIPYVKEAKVLDDDRVKVIFSEPVTNVDEAAFTIKQLDGKAIEIAYDELNDKDRIVTEVVLRLKDKPSQEGNYFTPGWDYRMTFNANVITDAAEWNALQTTKDNAPYVVQFAAYW
ncbi:Ig-like domain-containing protein [Cohnella sp. GCM10027633]|uniref:Ig-like domain-containing protein n=1 Tax=unclassified Cohnella TaxID=2636738 RepID=UPI00362EEA26